MINEMSVVITTYNRPELLKRCIESIYSQNYSLIEIIVVDDHSVPSYKNTIIEMYPNIKYIYQKENRGPGIARNKGIKLARNNFVILIDDDDIFIEGAFNEIKKFLSNNSDLNYPVFNFLRSNAKLDYNKYFFIYSFSNLIEGSIVGDVTHIINKRIFEGENQYKFPNSRIGAELLLWYRIAIDYGYPVINKIIVNLMDDSDERLTNINRQVKNAPDFAKYQIDIIDNFEEEIIKVNNLSFLVTKYKGAITYLLLAGKKKEAFKFWKRLCSFSKRQIVLGLLFLLPTKLIVLLFYRFRNS